jgi:hypothetical protein
VIAAAYRYAEDGGVIPREIEAGILIDRFGAQAVYGRTLGVKEIRRIAAAENVVNSYRSRQASTDWYAWAKDHPDMARLRELGAVLNGSNDGG